jgi:hypothetical protein
MWLHHSLSAPAAKLLVLDTEIVVAGAISGGYLPAAIRVIQTEREYVEEERDAFEEFSEEVKSLSTGGQSVMGTTAEQVNSTANNCVLATVRDTYRETVMSTADFETEYGETFSEHVAAEFGDDVASLLVDGHHLHEPVKRLLVEQARQSARQREQFLAGLDVEERSLCTAESTLESVEQMVADIDETALLNGSFPELIKIDSRLRAKREQCTSLLQTRQQEIHTVNRRMRGDSRMLPQEYFYRSLPVNFPVLSTTLEYINEINSRRSALVDAVCWYQ